MLKSELIPAREKGSRRLLVVLHGLGDSIEGYRFLPQELGVPWLNYLLVNAPDEYYGGYSWFDFFADPGPGIERSRRLLFELLDAQSKAGFPSEQTIVFGFSQGCLMAMEVGLRYPHRLAGVIGISGKSHEPERALLELSPVAKEQHFLWTHGTHDPVIPIQEPRAHMAVLKGGGLQIEWREFVKEHSIAGEEELGLIRQFIRKRLEKVGI